MKVIIGLTCSIESRRKKLSNNIILIGFMGTGKTTVGKIISSCTKYSFFDMDQQIEKNAGMSVNEIFSQKGESYFREQEEKVLDNILTFNNAVISCGGGVIKHKANRDKLKKNGTVFCLKADIDSIIKRTSGNTRPLLINKTEKEVLQLIRTREGLYGFADHFIDTTGKTPIEVAHSIISIYKG